MIFSLLMLGAGALAQQPDASIAAKRTNSLKQTFVPVPGTAVLMALNETRVGEYQVFVAGAAYDWRYKPHFEQGLDHPVVGVALKDAMAFCNWLTESERKAGLITAEQLYRLPTNREWGAAAGMDSQRRAGGSTAEDALEDERRFFWGLEWPPPINYANYSDTDIPGYDDGYPFTSPVGRYKPTAEGIYDLAGNVWEWTLDGDLRSGARGTLRGGSWAYFRPECLKPAYVYSVPMDLVAPTVGFRCVFEDRARTAQLLASAEKRETEDREKQRSELMSDKGVNAADVEALRESLGGAGSSVAGLPDPAKLKPAEKGQPFMSSLGLNFAPLSTGSDVLIGNTEVRVRDYELWLKATAGSWKLRPTFPQGAEHPAAGATWEDAVSFCAWLTQRDRAMKLIPETAAYRLPKDLEWSMAAGLAEEKGSDPEARNLGDQEHFPWRQAKPGIPEDMTANLKATAMIDYSDSFAYTAPVTTTEANALGLHDMGGNVAEWVAEAWPSAPMEHVIRGASYLSSKREELLTSARRHLPGTVAAPDVGFRCVLDLSGAGQ
ncbi:MAG: SUMF1/EgtB/PvdO family nonheme iron enzyme [Verrucomicrobiales bacterium]|nr:SUMF1/EgtB/PvdO family nonheme iron enzyme [Verrucomicrobiales bacterium]MCP5559041.1 SUMF1/EgtB/PvdO family nonheme iron enzyme [Verrucomicrobiaceae bacterium]